MSSFPPFEYKDLPEPPPLRKAVGVGIVVMGLAMGTGELILWPHLLVKYGLGLLWLALLGITFQYFINQEVARHALATGESFFTTSARLIKWSPFFWIISAILLYIWPGWASALGTILKELFDFGDYHVWAWVSLALVLVLTFSGRVAYRMLERALKVTVPLFIFLLVVISFFNLTWANVKEGLSGLVNFGHVPVGIDLNVLLGAVVFAGAGGMLNLCVSLWYRDKQEGMARYNGRITNPITGTPEAISATGYLFHSTPENVARWRGWMNYLRIDQGLVFWFTGLVSLFLLGVNAHTVLTPMGLVPEGTNVAIVQANIFGEKWGTIGYNAFLVMAYLMLFSVMWTVLDALTRIVSDIIHTNARVGKYQHYFSWLDKVSLHHLYYVLIVNFVFIGAVLVPFNQPLSFLVISSVLGGLAMAIYTPFLIYINNRHLAPALRPGFVTNFAMICASLFYLFFAYKIITQYLF